MEAYNLFPYAKVQVLWSKTIKKFMFGGSIIKILLISLLILQYSQEKLAKSAKSKLTKYIAEIVKSFLWIIMEKYLNISLIKTKWNGN